MHMLRKTMNRFLKYEGYGKCQRSDRTNKAS